MIIHINGWPGVGKYTVAKIVAERLDARLLDNHLIINPATAITEHGSEAYTRLTAKIRGALYAEMAGEARDRIHVLTDALEHGGAVSREIFGELEVLAQRRDVQLLLVALECSVEENIRRLQSPERADRLKLRDAETLRQIRREHGLARPGTGHRLDLDTTDLGPDAVAHRIIEVAKPLRPA